MKRYLFLLLLCAQVVYAQRKPNVIYIYADDMGVGELGSYGQQKIRTPWLDQLAKEGMRFTRHYSSFPVCAPSRCALMTGRHAGHSFIRGNYEMGGFEDDKEGGQMPLPEGTFTIAQLMKRAGYVTGAIGKWGLGMNNTTGDPNRQGFDYFYGYLDQKQAHNFYPTHLWENGRWDTLRNPSIKVHQPIPAGSPDATFEQYKGKDYSIDKMAEKTVAFIRKNRDKPFFLYLPYTGPHVSLQAPDEAVKEYIGQFDEKPYYGQKGYAPAKYPLSTYAAMITYFDKQIGKVMQLLKDLHLDDNTIVMFSSDNGATFNVGGTDTDYFNSAMGLRGRKQDLYEGGIRAPFLVRWPGKVAKGTVSDHLSVQFDLMATLGELTGVSAGATDGISFLPTLLGQSGKQKQHPYLYFEFPEKSGQVAIIRGHLKAIKTNMKEKGVWEVYDLQKDEKETSDLSAAHTSDIRAFEAILKKDHYQATVQDWEFVDPKFKKK